MQQVIPDHDRIDTRVQLTAAAAPRRRLLLTALAAPCLGILPKYAAGADPQAESLLRAQREAMKPLAIIDGLWRGPARAWMPDGSDLRMTQTERVGPMLDGTIRVIEGRGHLPDGTLVFHAFAVIGYEPGARRYHFRSWAQGRWGEFPFELRPAGFSWSTPAGPGATLRYEAEVRDGLWRETGHRVVDGQPPQRTFEMNLQRLGDTAWPADGAIPPR